MDGTQYMPWNSESIRRFLYPNPQSKEVKRTISYSATKKRGQFLIVE